MQNHKEVVPYGSRPIHVGIGCAAAGRRGEAGGFVETLLGSCVSTVICDPVTGVSGLNHIFLSRAHPGTEPDLRHAGHSVDALVSRLIGLGAAKERLIAKIYGGSNLSVHMDVIRVGELNLSAAKEALQLHGIPHEECVTRTGNGIVITLDTVNLMIRARGTGQFLASA